MIDVVIAAYQENRFSEALDLSLKLIKRGDGRGLFYAGMSLWHLKQTDYERRVNNYLNAAVISYNDPLALSQINTWTLEKFYTGFNQLCPADIYSFKCFLAWEWASTREMQQRKRIEYRSQRLNLNYSYREKIFSPDKLTLSYFDQLWCMVAPFWVFQCGAYSTSEKKRSLASALPDFSRVATVWVALHQRLSCAVCSLYLVYVPNAFNEGLAFTLSKTMNTCGYPTQLVKWEEVADTNIPAGAVVGILSDISLMNVTQEKIQQYAGTKLWIPWQLPEEIEAPAQLGTCINLKISLRDQPVSVLWGERGLPNYMYNVPARTDSRLLGYLRRRIEHNAALLYVEGLNQEIQLLSQLWLRTEYKAPDVFIHSSKIEVNPVTNIVTGVWPSRMRALRTGSGFNLYARTPISDRACESDEWYELALIEYFCTQRNILLEVPSLLESERKMQEVFVGYCQERSESVYTWPTKSVLIPADSRDHDPLQSLRIFVGKKELLLCVYFFDAWSPALKKLYESLVGDFFAPVPVPVLAKTPLAQVEQPHSPCIQELALPVFHAEIPCVLVVAGLTVLCTVLLGAPLWGSVLLTCGVVGICVGVWYFYERQGLNCNWVSGLSTQFTLWPHTKRDVNTQPCVLNHCQAKKHLRA